MKSGYLFIAGGTEPGMAGCEVKRSWRVGTADKGLLLNVGCSNQAQPFSRRVPAESSDLMRDWTALQVFFGRWIFEKRFKS
jgi:hypothetical protein